MKIEGLPQNRKQWIKTTLLIIVSVVGFSYLYRYGVSPVWAAVVMVVFPGFFRFIYQVVCFLVAAAIFLTMLYYLIF